MRKVVLSAAAAAAIAFGAGIAVSQNEKDQTLPTMRGVDHVGVTVTDSDAAIAFFEEVIGCKAHLEFGPFSDPEGDFMKNLLNVHPRAVINQITVLRCGNGSNVELLEYDSPDQNMDRPANSDVGGHHVAFYVDDIDKAAAWLKAHNIRTFLGPLKVEEGPAAGQTILYFLAPWGLQMELISYPEGMAYEKTADGMLWSPKNQ